jgi:hypothetical protein
MYLHPRATVKNIKLLTQIKIGADFLLRVFSASRLVLFCLRLQRKEKTDEKL